MLVALQGDQHITAWVAQKGPVFHCPNCKTQVILRKGALVAHNFAHKPPVTCSWASGETQAHLKAKLLLHDAFVAQGLSCSVEAEVVSGDGDRRADVLVWRPPGQLRIALEVQHTPLNFEQIDRRTRAYMSAGVPVVWLGLIKPEVLAGAEPLAGGLKITRYSVRPWEKWAHAYGMGELWFIDPVGGQFWRGVLHKHMIEVPSSSWYSSGGEEQSAGGYTRSSKRWRNLHVEGPYPPSAIGLKTFTRNTFSSRDFTVPGGRAAGFMVRAPKP